MGSGQSAKADFASPDLIDRTSRIRIVLPGNNDSVRQALFQLEERLKPLGMDAEDNGTTQIVVAEALNNIVEHAYAKKDGIIVVEAQVESRGLGFRIIDNGSGMPDGQLPMGELNEIPPETQDLPEGGFGWFLIHELTYELKYERQEGRNLLSFRLDFENLSAKQR